MKQNKGLITSLKESGSEWVVPAIGVCMIFVMLVPMPAFLLDLLLTISLTASVLVLLTAMQILKPTQFSVFPSLLLLLTLFRLSLDLASSKRILLHGSEGPSAAGRVIEAFGQFVVGGNYVVGFVVFLALIAIQYLVISHGAVRTAEVTARFTLDAMPGKQMSIDADMNAGLINEEQARKRREQIAHEAEFYGAMDGAARFNQRDSMATILITAINIVAGFLIGVLQQGIPFVEALKTYTILTVGHGLVTTIPSLLVSMAGGMVLTRAASENSLSVDIGRQVFSSRRALYIAGAVLLSLALVPGLPKIAFLVVGGLVLVVGRKMRPVAESAKEPLGGEKTAKEVAAAGVDQLEGVLRLDELMLEVGVGLVPLVDTKQGGALLGKIKGLRKHLALQLGFLVPSIHITDNLGLRDFEYVIHLRGVEIARWEMRKDVLLAISSDTAARPIAGIETTEPAFRAPAIWIRREQQAEAVGAGYAVVDQTTVLATHIGEVIKQNAYELLTRQETKRLIDRVSDSYPKLIEELIPKLMTLGEVQKVLQQLLREQVSIRDLGSILEVLAETASVNKNPVILVEAVRHALGRALVRPLLNDQGELKVVRLDHTLEEECNKLVGQQQPATGTTTTLQIPIARRVLEGLKASFGENIGSAPPVLLCSSPGRFYLRRIMEPFLPKLVVLAPTEIPPVVPVQAVGSVR